MSTATTLSCPIPVDDRTIELATRVQRRRDFTAHLTGFIAGAVALGAAALYAPSLRSGVAAALLAWSTALSFQHFRHVMIGPVTSTDVAAEDARCARLAEHVSVPLGESTRR